MNAKTSPLTNTQGNNANDTSIGSLLRASRNRRNEELSEVSAALRIRQVYLEAIENNAFEKLPGAIYAIGFIRSYAEYLGLDGEEIVRRYKTEETTAEKKQDLTFPSLVPEHGIPGGAIVMLGLVLAAIGYGSWYFVSTRNIFVTEQVPAVPEKLTALVGEEPVATEPFKAPEKPASSANTAPPPEQAAEAPSLANAETGAETTLPPGQEAPESPKSLAEPVAESAPALTLTKVAEPVAEVVPVAPEKIAEKVPEKVPEPTPEPTQPEPQAAAKPAEVTLTEPTEPVKVEQAAATPTPKIAALPTEETALKTTIKTVEKAAAKPAPVSSGSSRITLRAIADSYIQVRDNDADQLLITRLLKQGESYQVPDRTGLSLITGNAGALEILVDGATVPSIGPTGAVRRNVVLEAEKLIEGSAVVE